MKSRQTTIHPRLRKQGAFSIIQWLIVCALLGIAAYGGFRYWKREHTDAPAYTTAQLVRGPITQVVTASGTMAPVLNVQVGSQVSGNIQKLLVDFNSPVKAGQVVAEIDPAIYQANVTEAEGDLESAKAARELAQIVAKRTQELRDKDGTPQSTLDSALASLHQAEAAVKIKQGALDNATANLEHCTIYSPIDGIVISRDVDVGQTVAASLSAPVIFQIANDLSKMEIDASVAEADIGNVKTGQNVDFTVDAFPYRTFHGQVRQVRNAPISVQNVVTYDTVISVNNDELLLKPGMTANVSIVIEHRDDALLVGNSALRVRLPEIDQSQPGATPAPSASPMAHGGGGGGHGGGGHGGNKGEHRTERTVYMLPAGKDSTPSPVKIKTGISDGINTEVVSGDLKAGDPVITAVETSVNAPAQSNNPFAGGGPRRF